jgi:hypothetical protein
MRLRSFPVAQIAFVDFDRAPIRTPTTLASGFLTWSLLNDQAYCTAA